MKLNTQSILSQLDNLGVALGDRSYLISVAFARAISYSLPVPTSPVDNPYLAFTTQHKADVEAMAAELNERLVVDITTVTDLVCRLWVFRYRLVHDVNNTAMRQFMDAVIKVGSMELPPKVSEWLIKYESTEAFDAVTKYLQTAINKEG